MLALPLEIWQSICEYTAEKVLVYPRYPEGGASANRESSDFHFVSLLGFSQASRECRAIAIPYLFRRIRVRTVEQASLLVGHPIMQYARHVHFPEVDSLTCRRPIPKPVLQLVSQVKSMRIAAANPVFFLTARTSLNRLLGATRALEALELYSKPISQRVDTMAPIAGFIPILPSSLRALYIAMPGGRPQRSGVETLWKALQPVAPEAELQLPNLETIGLSVHLIPQFTTQPERVALGLAHRLPALRRVTIVAPGVNPLLEEASFDTLPPGDDLIMRGGFAKSIMRWDFERSVEKWRTPEAITDANPDDLRWSEVESPS